MTNIDGIENEYRFVCYLNGKFVKELNPLFRDLIDYLFPNINENYVTRCWRNKLSQKSDIFIKADGKIKGISIKKGSRNSIHVERISDFVHFLIENNVPKEVVTSYLKYHYADGSTNGKGKKRISSDEYKKNHQNEIQIINSFFNNDDILYKAIERFLIKGNNSEYEIDALIYGEVNDFLWIGKEDIKRIAILKKDIKRSGIHFSVLFCQPKNRNLNYNSKYEKDRFCIQVKWYSLFDDIIEFKNNTIEKS